MVSLHSKDMPIDEEFIFKTIGHKIHIQILPTLLATKPIVNLKAYVKEIKDLSIKRELLLLSSNIQKNISEEIGFSTEEILDEVQSDIYKISQDNSTQDFKTSFEITQATIKYMQMMKEKGSSYLIGEDTGFTDLNKKTTGFGKGDLIIIAARPAMGKTSLVLNMALKNIMQDRGVAFFSLEMPAEQLMLRLLSAKTSIPLQNLRIGNLRDEEWSHLSKAMDELSNKNLFVDDGGSLNINQLKAKLRKLKGKNRIDLVIIDYLQLMIGTGSKDRHQEVSEISRGLKMLARELEIPVIALSQLNRGVDSRADKRPMLSDLRESGAIEQDADIILFVYRDDVYRERDEREKEKKARDEGKDYTNKFESKMEEEAEIIIGKQRNGPIGTVKLIFQKSFTRFVDADGDNHIEYVYNIQDDEEKIESAQSDDNEFYIDFEDIESKENNNNIDNNEEEVKDMPIIL